MLIVVDSISIDVHQFHSFPPCIGTLESGKALEAELHGWSLVPQHMAASTDLLSITGHPSGPEQKPTIPPITALIIQLYL